MAPKRKKTSKKTNVRKKSKKQPKKKARKSTTKKKSTSRTRTKSKTKQKSKVSTKKDKRRGRKAKRKVSSKSRKPTPHKVLKLKLKSRKLKTKKRVVPEKKRVFNVPFYDVKQGSPEGYSEGISHAPETYMCASNANRQSPDFALPLAFEKAFLSALKNTHFEPDEIMIYRHGIIIRPRKGTFASEDKAAISKILQEIPGSSVHHVKENETFSLRINIGSPTKGELAGTISDQIVKYKHLLAEIYESIVSTFGASEWFSFWDTEEFGLGSG